MHALGEVLRELQLGERVARERRVEGARVLSQPQVVDELRAVEHIALRRDEGKLAHPAALEEEAAQCERQQILGALVVACASDVRGEQHRVRRRDDALHHALARRVLVVRARNVVQTQSATQQREWSQQRHPLYERPEGAALGLVRRVHVRLHELRELDFVACAQHDLCAQAARGCAAHECLDERLGRPSLDERLGSDLDRCSAVE